LSVQQWRKWRGASEDVVILCCGCSELGVWSVCIKGKL
jgi:hypothetical protein